VADSVAVSIAVGEPTSPAVSVVRSETVVVEDGQDSERIALEALAMVDRICDEVKKEALRQTRIVLANIQGNASRE
jgi:hypothetical protein